MKKTLKYFKIIKLLKWCGHLRLKGMELVVEPTTRDSRRQVVTRHV